MKIDITVKGVSLEQAQEVIAKLVGNAVTVATPFSSTAHVAAGLPAPAPAHAETVQQNLQAAASGEPDDAPSTLNVSGQVDAEGLPWDGRIHSSNKKMTGAGVWVRRRGLNPGVFEQVAAELRGSAVAQQPQPLAPAPVMPPQSFAPPPPPAPVAYTPPMPPMPPAPAAPVPPMPPQAPSQYGINDLFTKIQQLFATGAADANYVISLQNRISQAFQVQINSLNDISGRAEMISYAFQLITADGK